MGMHSGSVKSAAQDPPSGTEVLDDTYRWVMRRLQLRIDFDSPSTRIRHDSTAISCRTDFDSVIAVTTALACLPIW